MRMNELLSGVRSDVGVKIFGDDLDILLRLGGEVQSVLESIKGSADVVTANIEHLEKRMVDLPQPPTALADVMLAQEIRQYIRGQKSPIDMAVQSIADPHMLGPG
jgi:heavy metal efflux system protein